ncbi:hypothetical protein PQR02_32870, partial [Paraburkholderia sediminicola]
GEARRHEELTTPTRPTTHRVKRRRVVHAFKFKHEPRKHNQRSAPQKTNPLHSLNFPTIAFKPRA